MLLEMISLSRRSLFRGQHREQVARQGSRQATLKLSANTDRQGLHPHRWGPGIIARSLLCSYPYGQNISGHSGITFVITQRTLSDSYSITCRDDLFMESLMELSVGSFLPYGPTVFHGGSAFYWRTDRYAPWIISRSLFWERPSSLSVLFRADIGDKDVGLGLTIYL